MQKAVLVQYDVCMKGGREEGREGESTSEAK